MKALSTNHNIYNLNILNIIENVNFKTDYFYKEIGGCLNAI